MRKHAATHRPPHLVPLGDSAVLGYCPDEAAAVAWAAAVRHARFPWLEDVVPAYSSVGVFFDLRQISLDDVIRELAALPLPATATAAPPPRRWRIPVCYEEPFAPDAARVCAHTGLSPHELVHHHAATVYTVYAIGFVPGFPYLGYLPAALSGVPRRDSPRRSVPPGSIGLAGRQTGIYPLPRPGGWNLIGRTPLVIVDLADAFFPIAVGDQVRFVPISAEEFARYEGQRLGPAFLEPPPQ